MKKITLALAVCFIFVMTTAVMAGNPKGPGKGFEGKTAANNGFTNIVDNNFPDNDVSGYVKYSKNGDCLETQWNIHGLAPNTEYQLKLANKGGDTRINVCAEPCDGPIPWLCGSCFGDSFLVMDFAFSNPDGHIQAKVAECRLPSGDYEDAQFIVTQNSSPWSSAWTWENPGDKISTFSIE